MVAHRHGHLGMTLQSPLQRICGTDTVPTHPTKPSRRPSTVVRSVPSRYTGTFTPNSDPRLVSIGCVGSSIPSPAQHRRRALHRRRRRSRNRRSSAEHFARPRTWRGSKLSITGWGDLERPIVWQGARRIGERVSMNAGSSARGHDDDEAETENLREAVHVIGDFRPVERHLPATRPGWQRRRHRRSAPSRPGGRSPTAASRRLPPTTVRRRCGRRWHRCAPPNGRRTANRRCPHDDQGGDQHPQVVALRAREGVGRVGA